MGKSKFAAAMLRKRYNHTDATTITGTQLVHEWVHHLSDQGYDIIDASRGKPSFAVNDCALAAMQSALSCVAGSVFPYGTDALGEPHYREAVASVFSDFYQTDILPEQIIFTPGGQMAMHLAFRILHERCVNGVFVSTSPGYLNYEELIRYTTGSDDALLSVHLRSEDNYRYTASRLEEALANNLRPIAAFIFCNPVNPTGQVMSAAQWHDFAMLLTKYNAPIIMDEAFIEVVFNDTVRYSLLQIAPQLKDRLIILRSGTKALGFPGERLCVNVVPSCMVENFRYHQSRLLGNPPLMAQAGMAAAVSALSSSALKDISDYYYSNARMLMTALDRIIGADAYTKPEGGFFLLANFSHLLGRPMPTKAKAAMYLAHDTICTDEDIMAALMFGLHEEDKKGVALIPGSYFGLDPKAGVMRISYSISAEEILQMSERLSH